MKKTIRKFLAAAGVMLLPAMAQTSLASHFQGSELTYTCVAPGMYSVTCKMYRDCTGASAPTQITLNLKSQGCNTGRTITVNASGAPRIGDPYCPQIPKGCSATRANYEEVVFTTIITFSAAEKACPNWIISTLNSARPEIVNIQNAQGNLYSEAYINLTAGVNNNSPMFGNLVVPYLNAGKPVLLSTYAVDSEGDSLVYSLRDPLSDVSTPYTYATYQQETIYNSDSTKFVIVPGGTYSATYPIHSYVVDWTQPIPQLTAVKSFVFDTHTGSMAFTPTRYRPNSSPSLGQNKYVVVVQVDEYRKLNGVPTKIGSVCRDMLITLSDCGPNSNPTITGPVANGQPISPSDVINLRPGTPLTFQFASADLNANDVLNVTSDAGLILNGAVFTKTSANKPTGTITWTPNASDVRDQVYYFHIITTDNSCPIKGSQTQTYGVRVSNTGGVTGLKKEVSDAAFIAYPNPFSQEVSFKLNLKNAAQKIIIYNALGQEVDRISLAGKGMGEQSTRWENASGFASGTYVAKLVEQGNAVQTIKFSKLQ